MKNKECDIIRDLLPSYVDDICSEASNLWIKEHLAECEECRKLAEVMKQTEFSAKQLEVKQLDAAKKVRQKQNRYSMVSLGLCLLMTVLMVVVFELGRVQVPHLALYIALPLCMIMTWFANRNQSKKRSWDKWDTVSLAAAVLATAYGTFLMLYCFYRTAGGGTVFDLKAMEIGPFLKSQMVLAAVICLLLYVVQIVRSFKQGSTNSAVLHLCLTGMFLMMAYCVLLGYLSDVATAAEQIKKATLTILDVGLVNTAVFALLDKFTGK